MSATAADIERQLAEELPYKRPERDLPPATLPDVEKRDDGWAILLTCQDCESEFLLPLDEKPSDVARRAAKAYIRTCRDCLAKDDIREASRERADRESKTDIPSELRGLTFEGARAYGGDDRLPAIRECMRWARRETAKPGLYLFGSVGVGKTMLAATAAWEYVQLHEPIRWVSVARLMTMLDGDFSDADRKAALKILKSETPIVLDDIDKVNPTERGRNFLFTAVDQRAQAGVPMIVTANVKLSKIGEKFGEPLMSRLAGACTQFELTGRDNRLGG